MEASSTDNGGMHFNLSMDSLLEGELGEEH